MIYTAKYNKPIILFYISLLIISFSLSNTTFLLILQTLLTIFLILSLAIKYRIKIHKESISYQIFFIVFNLNLTIAVRDIKYIKLTAPNFFIKGAKIITKYKFIKFINLVNFKPGDINEDLIIFAINNNIKIIKTKKYSQLFE